ERMHDRLQQHRQLTHDAIRERLARGIAEGDVPATVSADALAGFYIAVLQGLAIQARDRAPPARLQAVADQALRAWDVLV
ncbi:TetR family transcriptional regulator C-terminal domain-containing protein, partial [Streptomyces galilaeus]|uniref:TetR family transcriptional regulator C-terminal domain-containing protein n=1 Tax=Streptomyces galilaeus TaxID=33899 RepID=UPI0038F68698